MNWIVGSVIFLELDFGIDGFNNSAENGCFVKFPDSEWEILTDLENSWADKVMEIFEYYTERTPGSRIERKDLSILWHYKDADAGIL